MDKSIVIGYLIIRRLNHPNSAFIRDIKLLRVDHCIALHLIHKQYNNQGSMGLGILHSIDCIYWVKKVYLESKFDD